jgi:hypothetical protein
MDGRRFRRPPHALGNAMPLTAMPRRRALALAFFAVVSVPLAALAQDAAPSKKKKKKKQVASADAAKPVGKTTFSRGSEESTAERDRRLYRECQGRPNAGACAGYAR